MGPSTPDEREARMHLHAGIAQETIGGITKTVVAPLKELLFLRPCTQSR